MTEKMISALKTTIGFLQSPPQVGCSVRRPSDTKTDNCLSTSSPELDLKPPEGFLLNADPLTQQISDWYIQSSFLNCETAHDALLNAANHDSNLLAKAFYVRFHLKKNNFNIPFDMETAKSIANELLPWLLQQVNGSSTDKSLMVACCEYIIGYYHCHNLIPNDNNKTQREEAVAWMTRSADHYYPPAISNLGVYYDIGEGVCKDMKKAVDLYQRAASMGFAPAICNLATCMLKGEGIGRDLPTAVALFTRSFELGFLPAATNLGYCYDKGQGVTVNKIEAVRLYRIAAVQGNQSAQYNLGLCYEKGEGLDRDLTQAIYWYKQCAAQGDQQSATKVTLLEYELASEDCPICLEKANLRGKRILIAPGCCGKFFHEECFQLMVLQCSDHTNRLPRLQCPLCREPFPSACLQRISSLENS